MKLQISSTSIWYVFDFMCGKRRVVVLRTRLPVRLIAVYATLGVLANFRACCKHRRSTQW